MNLLTKNNNKENNNKQQQKTTTTNNSPFCCCTCVAFLERFAAILLIVGTISDLGDRLANGRRRRGARLASQADLNLTAESGHVAGAARVTEAREARQTIVLDHFAAFVTLALGLLTLLGRRRRCNEALGRA